MSQIMPNRNANDVQFAMENGDMSVPTMQFQARLRPQRQANVVALRPLQAKLTALNGNGR
jgi:hypothetical protein